MGTPAGETAWIAPAVGAALVTGILALFASVITAVVTYRVAAGRAKTDRELAELKAHLDYRTEFAAEDTARTLLDYEKLPSRTFGFLPHRLRGFQDDELRRILVRCGAVHILGKRVRSGGAFSGEIRGFVTEPKMKKARICWLFMAD
jgi:hypothetical protein